MDSPSLFFAKLFGSVALVEILAYLFQIYADKYLKTKSDAVRAFAKVGSVLGGIIITIFLQYTIVVGQIIISTPNLVEPRPLSHAEAKAIVERSGLAFRVVDEVFDDEVEAQLIVKQEPNPGVYLALGKPVNVVVSKGPKPSLKIMQPTSEKPTSFPTPPAICSGTAVGEVSPLRRGTNEKKMVVYLLVFPLDPYGGGWWLMDESADVDAEGKWTCHYQLGHEGNQPKTGDKFKLRAVLASEDSILPRLSEPLIELDKHILFASGDVVVTVNRE